MDVRMKFSTVSNHFAQKDIVARDWDHALIRLEYAIAIGHLPPGTEICGELISREDTELDKQFVSPVGRIS